jgi:hypothetical protein
VIDPIYENDELIGFAKITRDITERQNAMTELLKSDDLACFVALKRSAPAFQFVTRPSGSSIKMA